MLWRDERLPLILGWLNEGSVIMALTLAWRLDVSVRTVYRDVNILREQGHRIDSSPGHGGGLLLRTKRKAA